MRVLLIEDEPELLRVLARALREAGYAVDEAADGEEGLFKATGCDYDAVVLDLMLPRRDGWQVLGVSRGDDRSRQDRALAVQRDETNARVGVAFADTFGEQRHPGSGCNRQQQPVDLTERHLDQCRRNAGVTTGR